jgi:hypothetical protein
LHAPAIFTVVVTSSSSGRRDLVRIVTSAPRMLLSLNSRRRNCGYSSAFTPIGTTTASMPAVSK